MAAGQTDIEPQKGKPGNGSRPEPKQTREGHGRRRQVGEPDPKGKEPKVWRKSDPLVVLRRRESRLQGKGAGSNPKPAKETGAGQERLEHLLPTSLLGIAKKARSEKKHRFRDLYRMINGPMVYRC
jgi:hypothetical protein